VHAEQNAIAQSAKLGIPVKGATLYCQMTPCYTCAKIIINCGIIKVIAFNDYHKSSKTKVAFAKSGVVLEILNNVVETYKNQGK
jgi:dCMP deaminase